MKLFYLYPPSTLYVPSTSAIRDRLPLCEGTRRFRVGLQPALTSSFGQSKSAEDLCARRHVGFPEIRGTFLDTHHKDYSILKSPWGTLFMETTQWVSVQFGGLHHAPVASKATNPKICYHPQRLALWFQMLVHCYAMQH